MSLAIGKHCVSIVRRVNQGATDGFVSDSVDYRTADDVRLIFSFRILSKGEVLNKGPLPAKTITPKKDRRGKYQALESHTSTGGLRMRVGRRTVGTSQGNHSYVIVPLGSAVRAFESGSVSTEPDSFNFFSLRRVNHVDSVRCTIGRTPC